MKIKHNYLLAVLFMLAVLCACGTSGTQSNATTSLLATDSITTQTAKTLVFSVPSTPTVSVSPTAIPSYTPAITPVPTDTPMVSPTPMPPVIGVENAPQVILLDTIIGFTSAAGISFSPEGISAFRYLEDNTLERTGFQSQRYLSYKDQDSWIFSGISFSPDGKIFSSQTSDANGVGLNLWTVQEDLSLKPLAQNIAGFTFEGFYTYFSGDGKYLAYISIPKFMDVPMTADIWRKCAPNCELPVTYSPLISGIYRVPEGSLVSKLDISSVDSFEYKAMFSPENNFLATTSHRIDSNMNVLNYFQVWRVTDGKLYRYMDPIKYLGLNGEQANLSFSPNGENLAFIGGGSLRVWQWEANTISWTADGIFSSLAYSPDGNLLVTGKPDGSIQLWQAEEGKLLLTLLDHKHAILAVAFSPNGSLLVSLDENGVLKLWGISN